MPLPRARALHRVLLRVTLSAAQVYAWIFIFQFFYVRYGSIAEGIASVVLTYALTQVVTILLTPWTARALRHGFRRLMVYAVLLLASAFTVLSASFAGYLGGFGWGVGLFAVLMGAYRALYWVPYEVALVGQAREVLPSRTRYAAEILVAFMPVVAGLLLTYGPVSPIVLLSLAAVLSVVSILPLSGMRDVHEGFVWNYRQTFHELFSHSRRRMTLEAVMHGIEGAALLLLWPLVVFILLDWSYPMLGVVLSVTYLFGLFIRSLFHTPLSRASSSTLALLAASAWIMRLTVGGAVGVILVDTYFYIGSRPQRRGIDMGTYEQSADNATFVDEHTALKEMGIALGRLSVCLLVVMLIAVTSIPLTFMIAFLCAAGAAAYSIYLARAL